MLATSVSMSKSKVNLYYIRIRVSSPNKSLMHWKCKTS